MKKEKKRKEEGTKNKKKKKNNSGVLEYRRDEKYGCGRLEISERLSNNQTLRDMDKRERR